jgi:hypothetical protein
VCEAIKLNDIITPIVHSPYLPTRKLICEVLLSIIYVGEDALSLVFPALENLTRSNEVPPMNDPNDKRNVPEYYVYNTVYWFRT